MRPKRTGIRPAPRREREARLTSAGTALVIRGCDGAAAQKWARDAVAGPVKGAGSGRCLDVPDGRTDDGTRPALWDCDGGANQTWTSTASNQLRVFPTECLDAYDAGTANGTQVIIWPCDGAAHQKWGRG
ncbi:RICIN domain-containing protein [Streptomyces sp. NPDC088923]|uniref:RICIN domain-containing protein n=1 Tax=Streptomyces sp. NPDC088923 TaxID=3365913 RepID=UPI0038195CB6